MRWIDTTIRDLIRWIDTTITTRGAAEPRDPKRLAPRSQLEDGADHSTLTPNKLRAVLELRHEEAAPSRYNHGFEPAMATRVHRRPRFEPAITTR